jgi:sugar phosphate isomerase/epimerase
MQKAAIIGYTGFVGSYLRSVFPNSDLYNSKNISEIRGKHYDTIYCAGIPAQKWMANKNPEADFLNINNLRDNIDAVENCWRFILISTIDVHDHSHPGQTESKGFVPSEEPYGKHRLMFEEWIRLRFQKVHILRLPALFGMGLKKNALFDLLNGRMLDMISLKSRFQWYDIRWIVPDLSYMVDYDISLAHAYPEPMATDIIVNNFFPDYLTEIKKNNKSESSATYSHNSDYRCFRRSISKVLNNMREFIQVCRIMKNPGIMKHLAVSNIAWKSADDNHAAYVMKRYGINNIELVPTKYFKWAELLGSQENMQVIKDIWNEKGFDIVSLQSILYSIDGTFGINRQRLVNHMAEVSRVAEYLGAKIMVMGAPLTRSGPHTSEFDVTKALDDYVDHPRRSKEVRIAVEPNAAGYGCEVGKNYKEIIAIISGTSKSTRACVGVNYDTGNAFMEDDPPPDNHSDIIHVQVSVPFLRPSIEAMSYTCTKYNGLIGAMLDTRNDPFIVSFESLLDNVALLEEMLFLFILYLNRT